MASANSTDAHTQRKTQEWIRKARAKHSDRFGYNRVVYTHSNNKVEIYCPECDKFFWQRAAGHLQGDGCKGCRVRKASAAMADSVRLTQHDFLRKSRAKHGDRYNYDLVVYKNCSTKVKIVCKDHGEFLQLPSSHMNGRGCAQCGHQERAEKNVLSEQEFWTRVRDSHPNSQYDYSRVKYKRFVDHIVIGCAKHGYFRQTAQNHANGQGCRKCAVELRASNLMVIAAEKFVSEANQKHGDGTYLYHLVEYRGKARKVKIVCPKHGVFQKTPNDHLSKLSGCAKCFEDRRGWNRRKTVQEFINTCTALHSGKYDYSRVKQWEHGGNEKVIIGCKKHGWFKQRPQAHLRGAGCSQCFVDENADRTRLSLEEFVSAANAVHGEGRYLYDKVDYKRGDRQVVITCPIHGDFRQTPCVHVRDKCGCPSCSESKGECEIRRFLDELNVEYEREVRFPWCKHKKPLVFDFHIWGTKLLIEFDGQQHFEAHGSLHWFSCPKNLKSIQLRDRIKDESCAREGWDLVRIPYTEINNIESILRPALRRHGFYV